MHHHKAQIREAECPPGLDEIAVLECDRGGSGDPSEGGEFRQGDGQHQIFYARPQHRDDHQAQQQRRERQQNIKQAGDHGVEPAADIARGDADG